MSHIELIKDLEGIYYEKDCTGKHCYKFSTAGEEIIIESNEDQEKAAEKMATRLIQAGFLN